MTPEIAHAAATDAGNRSMRAAGRTAWNEDDYNACVREYDRLLPRPTDITTSEAARLLGAKGAVKGGQSTSDAKRQASRENGKKGGRKPAKRREYFGSAGHLIVSDNCRFHLATKIGDVLISTIGEYVQPGDGAKRSPDRYTTIGLDRLYETMVFKTCGTTCQCGCGLPDIVPQEIDFAGYNSPSEANAGHEAMCLKWSR